jgi:hypothetical protein
VGDLKTRCVIVGKSKEVTVGNTADSKKELGYCGVDKEEEVDPLPTGD